jgi:hypothetical protein
MMNRTLRTLYLALLLAMSGAGCASDDEATSDAGNAPGATTAEECFGELAPQGDAWFIELQRFKSEDGAVRVWRSRQPGDRSAVGETFPYDLVRAWIETDDEPGTCVTERSALTYEFGHHNWAEEWTVQTDRALYIGREMYSTGAAAAVGWTDVLEAQDESGATLFTVDLVDDGCETSPYDLNPCLMRMRTDEPPEGWGEE